jgi:PAS domain S-box-containing protein
MNVLNQFRDYAIVMIDASGKIQSWNVGAESTFGYSLKEAVGKGVEMLYSGSEVAVGRHISDLNLAVEKGRVEYRRKQVRSDGSDFFAHTILTAMYTAEGRFSGFALATSDVTEQQKLEQENEILQKRLEDKVQQRTKELQVVNKELEAFSYSVSHDLRTPLRAIIGFSQILREDYSDRLDEEGRRLLNNISRNTKMMGELIDDLLKFSKLSRLEKIDTAVDMLHLVQIVIDHLEEVWNKKRYTFIVSDVPPCSGDDSMLKQVWTNLIDNAMKYASKSAEPTIEIGGTADEETITYYVKDNGVGFDMKYAGNLFGVFQRLHTTEQFEGTGLGLALVQRIIHKHNGTVWAEASPDKGATFYFTIPNTKTNG